MRRFPPETATARPHDFHPRPRPLLGDRRTHSRMINRARPRPRQSGEIRRMSVQPNMIVPRRNAPRAPSAMRVIDESRPEWLLNMTTGYLLVHGRLLESDDVTRPSGRVD